MYFLAGAELHLNTTVLSVTTTAKGYKLVTSSNPQAPSVFDAVLVATPLENSPDLSFEPMVTVPPRKMQTTHATFVRGNLNPVSHWQMCPCLKMVQTCFLLEMPPNLSVEPPVELPPRKTQITHATFVRGNLRLRNPPSKMSIF